MKILHVYKDYYPVMGGIENMIKWVAEAQVEAGHEVTVLVASLKRQTSIEYLNGVQVHKVPRLGTLASVPLTPTLPFVLRQYEVDLIHIHSPYPPGELFGTFLGKAKHVVLTYHSDVMKQKNILRLYAPLLKSVLKYVDIIMPTSTNYIKTSSFLRPNEKKCQIVPLGIDSSRFELAAPPSLIKQLRTQFGHKVLLFVGRLRYYKGLDTLIAAMPHIPEVKLVIVGTGPMKSELDRQIQTLNVQTRVHFVNDISDEDLPAYFQAADCYVLPANSKAEAFGIAMLEAMASGLPCITTEVGTGTSWVVKHGVNGFVVPPKNPIALAQAINTLFNDDAQREAFAQASLERVKTHFSKEIMINKIMTVYETVMSS